MSSESTMWEWLSKARLKLGPTLHMCRIENLAGTGAADVEGMWAGHQFQIELKHAARRSANGGLLKFGSPLRPSQRDWGKARLAAGGAYCFLIQVGSGSDRGLYLVPAAAGNIDALYRGVNEEWCRRNSVLDTPRADRVVVLATALKGDP